MSELHLPFLSRDTLPSGEEMCSNYFFNNKSLEDEIGLLFKGNLS